MNHNFISIQKEKVKEIETIIERFLPKTASYQQTIVEAMNYSVMAGGKRLRPMLMKEVFDRFQGKSTAIESFMVALEMIHTYSLVHDDLPAMDNDEFRRGRKTTHIVYGESMGILAGDGLLNYAFELVSGSFRLVPVEEYANLVKAFQVLSKKAGIYGMIGGQVCDMESEQEDACIGEAELLFIHEHKTAALIQAAMMIGGILAGCEEAVIDKLEKAAYNIGLAFQIQDDVLDVTSTFEELGKPIGSDEKNDKLTYVKIYGLEHSKQEVERLSKEAIALLEIQEDSFLAQLLDSLITRSN